MSREEENRPVPAAFRVVLLVLTIVFLALQGWTLLGPGGIAQKYTLIEGFTEFDDLMLADPLTAAGLWDFLFLLIVFVIVVLNGVPRGPRYGITCFAFLAVMVVYPGAGALAFLLIYWRRLGQFRP